MLFEGLVRSAEISELDSQVAAVWKTVTCEDSAWLQNKIREFKVSRARVQTVLFDEKPRGIKEVAFSTIVRNRMAHGGLMADGAGILRKGEDKLGLRSRWYSRTLCDRITMIMSLRGRLIVREESAFDALRRHKHDVDAYYFIDPPYTFGKRRPGSRLYRHHRLDHGRLFDRMRELKGNFLATYEWNDEIQKKAKEHRFDFVRLSMKTRHHVKTDEILIGNDLSWFKD